MIASREEELYTTHQQRQNKINRLVDALRREAEALHTASDELNKRIFENEGLREEIEEIRGKCQSLNDIKKRWVEILK